MATTSGRMRFRPTDELHRVTTLELFFDLVFVFAFTQVTALMAADPTPDRRAARAGAAGAALVGLVLLRLAGQPGARRRGSRPADRDRGDGRHVRGGAGDPRGLRDLRGGLFAPFVLAACYAVVRVAHLVCYYLAAGDDAALQRQLRDHGHPGRARGRPARARRCTRTAGRRRSLWALALLVDYSGIYLAGTSGWRVHSAAALRRAARADRHRRARGVPRRDRRRRLRPAAVRRRWSLAAAFGVAIAVALWWLYFDVVAHVAERTLARDPGRGTHPARPRLLHLPALPDRGLDHLHRARPEEGARVRRRHRSPRPRRRRSPVRRWSRCTAASRSTCSATSRSDAATSAPGTRTARSRPRSCSLLLPIAWRLPAIAALGLVAAVLVALVVYELVRFGAARERGSPPAPRRRTGQLRRVRPAAYRRGLHDRVVPRVEDVAGDDRHEVELGQHPDHDRQPVEPGVAARRRDPASPPRYHHTITK